MEFKDYYKILEVGKKSSIEEIKAAFKKQAIKWHPDKNPDFDTTSKMQEINEAYLILKDIEGRERYDKEYVKYQEFYSKDNELKNEYEFSDEILKKWMTNARRQAIDLAIQTIKEVGEISITASKAAGSKILELVIAYSIFGFLFLILAKACSN